MDVDRDGSASGLHLRYSHPFTLAELEELDLNLVSQEITRLQKSLALLRSTNATLTASLPQSSSTEATGIDPISPDEADEFLAIIKENEEAIDRQEERVKMCKYTLMKRMGFDPSNKHYELELDSDTTAVKLVPPRQVQEGAEDSSRVIPQGESGGEQGGLYL